MWLVKLFAERECRLHFGIFFVTGCIVMLALLSRYSGSFILHASSLRERWFVFILLLPAGLLWSFSLWANEKPAVSQEELVIGLVLHGLENPAYQDLEEESRSFCERTARCRLMSGGPLNNQDVATQKQWLRQLIASNVDALVIAPISTRALFPVLKTAAKKGIAMVNIGARMDRESLGRNRVIIPWVGPDNRAAARQLAEALAMHLNPGDQVALLGGTPGQSISYERVDSARRTLRRLGMKVVAVESADWKTERALEKTQLLLGRFKNLKGLVAANDEMALGALRAADLQQYKLKVVGFDADPAILPLVNAGRIMATIDWSPRQQGVFAIEKLLADRSAGKTAGLPENVPGDYHTPWKLLTRNCCELVDGKAIPKADSQVRQ